MKTKNLSPPPPLFQLMIMYGGPNVMDGKLLPYEKKYHRFIPSSRKNLCNLRKPLLGDMHEFFLTAWSHFYTWRGQPYGYQPSSPAERLLKIVVCTSIWNINYFIICCLWDSDLGGEQGPKRCSKHWRRVVGVESKTTLPKCRDTGPCIMKMFCIRQL